MARIQLSVLEVDILQSRSVARSLHELGVASIAQGTGILVQRSGDLLRVLELGRVPDVDVDGCRCVRRLQALDMRDNQLELAIDLAQQLRFVGKYLKKLSMDNAY
eukprot:SAG31_NODE_1316_length_8838_cov_11.005031_5_plen_105_part_00